MFLFTGKAGMQIENVEDSAYILMRQWTEQFGKRLAMHESACSDCPAIGERWHVIFF